MKKFLVLLKKEIRELITLRLVLPLVIMTLVFGFIGKMISDQAEDISAPLAIGVVDQDQSTLSSDLIKQLNQSNFIVNKITDENYLQTAKDKNLSALMVIPAQFAENLQNLQKPEIRLYAFVSNFSLSGTLKVSRIESTKAIVNEFLSDYLINQRIQNTDPQTLKNPFTPINFTVINDRSAQISFSQLTGFIQSQTTFVPIILFLIIVIASQMVATTIATEKESKTLEILLSSPLNRKMIVFAKILASGIVALLFSLVYMIGFKSYISGFSSIGTGGQIASSNNLSEALLELGVVIDATGYSLLGLSLFLSILCALAIAIILGIMAEDVKGVQAVITPLMVLIMIPYFITMFADINSFSPFIKYLVYAIPFAHPFLAMQNVIVQQYNIVIFGIIYQLIVFVVFVVIAAHIFSSDKILTFKFQLKKRYVKPKEN